jgi:hypothetical protein
VSAERNAALLHDLAATAPKTALAVDRPMSAAIDLLDYRTQQVEALVETAAVLERDRARLVAALREWTRAERAKPSHVTTVREQGAFVQAERVLRELGEAE